MGGKARLKALLLRVFSFCAQNASHLRNNTPVTVGSGLSVARIHWAEPVKGTATVKDMAGNLMGQLTYSGSGQEPAQLNFNPPVATVNGVVGFAPGGLLHVYLSGSSDSGG
jgi:hypothetical protein